jgi:hypothetical protein
MSRSVAARVGVPACPAHMVQSSARTSPGAMKERLLLMLVMALLVALLARDAAAQPSVIATIRMGSGGGHGPWAWPSTLPLTAST